MKIRISREKYLIVPIRDIFTKDGSQRASQTGACEAVRRTCIFFVIHFRGKCQKFCLTSCLVSPSRDEGFQALRPRPEPSTDGVIQHRTRWRRTSVSFAVVSPRCASGPVFSEIRRKYL